MYTSGIKNHVTDPELGNRNPREVIGVDPGKVTGTGWLTATGTRVVLQGWRELKVDYRSDISLLKVAGYIAEVASRRKAAVAMEAVGFWRTNVGLDARKSGGIEKLAFLVGTINGYCLASDLRVRLILPGEWKGNLDKLLIYDVVTAAFGISRRQLPRSKASCHITDAIGLGCAHLLGPSRWLQVLRQQ